MVSAKASEGFSERFLANFSAAPNQVGGAPDTRQRPSSGAEATAGSRQACGVESARVAQTLPSEYHGVSDSSPHDSTADAVASPRVVGGAAAGANMRPVPRNIV